MEANAAPNEIFTALFKDQGGKRPNWYFEGMSPARNDALDFDEFFNADNQTPVKAFMREAFQNVSDAGARNLVFKWRKIHLSNLEVMDFSEIVNRIQGMGRGTMKATIDTDGFVNCLQIADDGHGLSGEYLRSPKTKEQAGGYQAFVSGFGNSSKVNDNSSGSKGLGRSQIMGASEIRTMVGFTRRADDGKSLAFGMSMLAFHEYEGRDYRPFGQYLVDRLEENMMPPAEGHAAEQFSRLVGFEDDGFKSGFSMLLPSVRPSFTLRDFVTEIVTSHVYPIVTGALRVTLDDGDHVIVIDRENICNYASLEDFGGSPELVRKIDLITKMIASVKECVHELEAPREGVERAMFTADFLERLSVDLADTGAAAVKVPFHPRERRRGECDPESGEIRYAIVAMPELKDGMTMHVRDRLATYSSGKPGYGIIVYSAGDAVARLLRDAEDPTHTKWIASKAHDKWPVQKANAIVSSFKDGGDTLHGVLTKRADMVETDGFAALFGLPSEDQGKKTVPDRGSDDDRPTPEPVPTPVVPTVVQDADLFDVNMIPACGGDKQGFHLFLNETSDELKPGETITLKAAYAVSKGNPAWDRHSPADFDFGNFDFRIRGCDIAKKAANEIEISHIKPNFDLKGHGDFKTSRGVVFQYTKNAAKAA